MKILLCTAPMVQINTPYPATAYLKGFIESRGIDATQRDPAIDLVLSLFSPSGLEKLKRACGKKKDPELEFFREAFSEYQEQVDGVVALLQGKPHPEAKRLAERDLLPEGPSFQGLHEGGPLLEQFHELSPAEKCQHLASLFLDDLALYYRLGADDQFQFSRYGEKLAASQPSFSPLEQRLQAKPSLIDEELKAITLGYLQETKPDLFCLSAPFAGTVYGALRMAEVAKSLGIKVALGGGYPNTELRSLSDPRIFRYVDFISLDDGETPLLALLDHLQGNRPKSALCRTYYLENGKVQFAKGVEKDIPFAETGTPTYEGLPLGKYISMMETLNPVTKLWSGYFWNKLTLAHGCYWHRCSFCDTSLDYIGRYETEKASRLVDRMEKISAQTGCDGFHFVDEAAPPAILRALSEEILRRKLAFRWWGNIRFDKAFNQELTQLMKEAGCIAVTGGLEVASERVLKLIDKGVSLEQVTKVTHAFQKAGIFVHAYLMFGFPSQTVQETVDSLEVVRQLFASGCLQSAFWHRFAATVHSPVGKNPEKYKIQVEKSPVPPEGLFSENDLPFFDPSRVNHDSLGIGLRKALYNYMHGIGLEEPVHLWFPTPVPKTKIPARFVAENL